MIAALVLIVLLAIASVVNSMRTATPQPTAQLPRVTDPSAIAGFDAVNAGQLNNLNNKPGKPGIEPAVTPLTTEQKKALGVPDGGGGARDGREEAIRRQQDREKQRKDALRSTSVLVDFPTPKEAQASSARAASGEPQPEERELDDVADRRKQLAAWTAHTDRLSRQKEDEAGTEQREPPREVAGGKDPGNADPKKQLAPWATYTGKLYRMFEGRDMIEAILMNRINGAAAGPLLAQVSLDIYSHDHQKLLIPQGTVLTGDVTAVNSTQQQRLFVAFHRMIMPDGFPVSLDKFAGLNQAGEVGLRDKVNHHYVSIFGASLAIGAIGGLTQIGNGSSFGVYDPGVEFRNGVSRRTGEEAMQILNHYLNQLTTFIVRERERLRIWLSNDLLLPAADNHTLPGDI
jgi:type IV secretion system protein VirB10